MMPYLFRFRPIFKRTLWGGRRLGEHLGKSIGPEVDYAESWEVVDQGVDQSVIEGGPLDGMTLAELLAEYPEVRTSVIGITRAYATRHGEGPFPTACARMSSAMVDPGNPGNDWQGNMRFGPLDMVLTEYAARVCRIDGIFVSGLDQLPAAPRIVTEYQQFSRLVEPSCLEQQQQLTTQLVTAVPIERRLAIDELLGILAEVAPIVGTAHGATAGDRELVSPPGCRQDVNRPPRDPDDARSTDLYAPERSPGPLLSCSAIAN